MSAAPTRDPQAQIVELARRGETMERIQELTEATAWAVTRERSRWSEDAIMRALARFGEHDLAKRI